MRLDATGRYVKFCRWDGCKTNDRLLDTKPMSTTQRERVYRNSNYPPDTGHWRR